LSGPKVPPRFHGSPTTCRASRILITRGWDPIFPIRVSRSLRASKERAWSLPSFPQQSISPLLHWHRAHRDHRPRLCPSYAPYALWRQSPARLQALGLRQGDKVRLFLALPRPTATLSNEPLASATGKAGTSCSAALSISPCYSGRTRTSYRYVYHNSASNS
jgi:hypothetical protein